MHGRIGKIPPVLKHGGYATTSVLPGESPAAFEKLHRKLKAEFSPSGALEDDIVMTLARLVWRKQNLMTMYISERAQEHLDAVTHPKYDPIESLEPSEQTEIDNELEQAENELGNAIKLIDIGEAATFEGLEKELAVRERLDSAITRCLKQMLMARGVKSMLVGPSSVSPKRVTGPPSAA